MNLIYSKEIFQKCLSNCIVAYSCHSTQFEKSNPDQNGQYICHFHLIKLNQRFLRMSF